MGNLKWGKCLNHRCRHQRRSLTGWVPVPNLCVHQYNIHERLLDEIFPKKNLNNVKQKGLLWNPRCPEPLRFSRLHTPRMERRRKLRWPSSSSLSASLRFARSLVISDHQEAIVDVVVYTPQSVLNCLVIIIPHPPPPPPSLSSILLQACKITHSRKLNPGIGFSIEPGPKTMSHLKKSPFPRRPSFHQSAFSGQAESFPKPLCHEWQSRVGSSDCCHPLSISNKLCATLNGREAKGGGERAEETPTTTSRRSMEDQSSK